MKRDGILLVVSGPSGVGKGTVIRGLMSRHQELVKSVSCTTRDPRPGEQTGQDYHFVTVAEFARMRAADELLEWATVHGDIHYGTPRRPVAEALAHGEDIILEIDYQGARSVRHQLGGRAVLVFIAPPTWHDLHTRLVGRETEEACDVQRRLETAHDELANIDLFQYLIVNSSVPQAVAELEAVLTGERQRLSRTRWHELQAALLAEAEASGE